MIVDKINLESGVLEFTDPYIRLGVGAKIINSSVVDNLTIDAFSCVNRCVVGRYFGLGCYSYVNNSQIGRYCTFGARVSIGAFSHPTNWLSIHEFQYRNTKNIYGDSILEGNVNIAPKNPLTCIGCDVWIGDNACVKAGVSLGHGAVVGLGAVVVKDVPPYAIVAGNPARILRYRFSKDVINELLEIRWWKLDMMHLKGIVFSDVNRAIVGIDQIRQQFSSNQEVE